MLTTTNGVSEAGDTLYVGFGDTLPALVGMVSP